MAPTAAHLRVAADGLRTTARRLDAELDPLAETGDHRTWEGPAATAYRRAAAGVEGRAEQVTAGLRSLAALLDQRAEELVRRAEEEAQRSREIAARVRAERDQGPRRGPDDPQRRPTRPPRYWSDAGPGPSRGEVGTGGGTGSQPRSDPGSIGDALGLDHG